MACQLAYRPKGLFTVPLFLAPVFTNPSLCCSRSFSASSQANTQVQRGNRDKNKKRGVSAIRRTGPRHRLSISKLGPLPKPVSDPTEARAMFEVAPDHGLWGFFNNNKEALIPPNEEDAHGRAWTVDELSKKGWQDLHRLYWVCVKESNIVRTRNNERNRLKVGYGVPEGEEKLQILSKTMHNIRQALVHRHYARFDAARLLDRKAVYELFPDILHRHIDSTAPELLQTEDSLQDDSLLLGDGHGLAGNTNSSPQLSGESLGFDDRATHQRQSQ